MMHTRIAKLQGMATLLSPFPCLWSDKSNSYSEIVFQDIRASVTAHLFVLLLANGCLLLRLLLCFGSALVLRRLLLRLRRPVSAPGGQHPSISAVYFSYPSLNLNFGSLNSLFIKHTSFRITAITAT